MNISLSWLVGAALAGAVGGGLLSLSLDRFPRAYMRSWLREAAGLLEDAQLVHNASAMPEADAAGLSTSAAALTARLDASRGDARAADARPWHRFALPGVCAALFPALLAQFGVTAAGGLWCAAAAALVALAVIDLEMLLLPDVLTLPLLWAGLGASALGLTIPLHDAVLGAAVGYLPLWGLYWAHKLITGQVGMGLGDVKLLAALGAWLGWAAVAPIAGGAAILAGLAHVVLRARRGAVGSMPFGPALIVSGLAVALFRPI